MKTIGIYQTYKLLIEKIFNQNSDFLPKKELLNKFNYFLEEEGNKQLTMRSIRRVIDTMKIEGYEFLEESIGQEKTIKLNFIPNRLILNKDELNAFPLIFGTMESEENLPTNKKIKELVKKEFGFQEKDLIDSKYFVKSEPEINNHSKIILLAGKLIYFAKNGFAIKYWYKNRDGIDDSKYIAPLQIRLYDQRYYLLGLDIDSITMDSSTILKNYCLDTFLNYEADIAYTESEDGLGEPKIIRFNHEELYKKSDLENKLRHSIGIYYDEKNTLEVIKLKFKDWAKGIVLNKKIHRSMKIIENKENYIIIQITIWNNSELDYIIGRFGNFCERLN
jgi:hypothetical protein